MREEVIKSLEKVRPVLQRDGGDVEFVDVNEEGVVAVRLQGACNGCPGATMTLKMLIEGTLKQDVPGVTQVINVM
ncbi:MAG: NifU family protein [Firmicutes bacterium]|jgi:Fe-S cluster biogenesis protein NfuA|nr:NifU family protein [Bacillota bacterium]